LDFNSAVKAARKQVAAARLDAKATADGPVLTVGLVAERYVAERDARQSKRAGRQIRSDTAQRLGRYLLGQSARGKQNVVAAAPLASIAIQHSEHARVFRKRERRPTPRNAGFAHGIFRDRAALIVAVHIVASKTHQRL
jgi:hypothetical protein